MNATQYRVGLLLIAMGWILSVRPLHAKEYVYGAVFSFNQGLDKVHVLRLAPVDDEGIIVKKAQIIAWKSSNGDFVPLLPTITKLTPDLIDMINTAKIPNMGSETTRDKLIRFLNNNLSKIDENGQIDKTELYIRPLISSTLPNRDAYMWFSELLSTVPDVATPVSLTELSHPAAATVFSAIYGLTSIKGAFDQEWALAQNSWRAMLEHKAQTQSKAESTPGASTSKESEMPVKQDGLLPWWLVGLVSAFALILLAMIGWLWLAVRRIQDDQRRDIDEKQGGKSSPLDSLAYRLDSLRHRIDEMHAAMLKLDDRVDMLDKPNPATSYMTADLDVSSSRIDVLREEFRQGLNTLRQQLEDIRSEILKDKPMISNCVGELVEMKSRLDGEEKKRSTWRYELAKEWDKALAKRDESFNRLWEERLGKWRGLRDLDSSALQARLTEAFPRLKEALPELIQREEELLQWHTRLRAALRQAGGSLLRVEDQCLRHEAAHQSSIQDMRKDYVPGSLRLDLRDAKDPADGLQLGLERFVESLVDPRETQADGFARELAALTRRLHEALDEHAGKALVQIRAIAPVCAERGITWITPPEGGVVDDKQHLVVDYRVGQGATSTIAELLRPGYELKSGERLLDRVQAQIVVYR